MSETIRGPVRSFALGLLSTGIHVWCASMRILSLLLSVGKFPASPAQMPSYRRDWYDKMLEYIRKGDEAKIRTEFQKVQLR